MSAIFLSSKHLRQDTDATQDWYLCSNKTFALTR